MTPNKLQYLLRLGDNALVLSQRLGEWCGKGQALEEDMALTNVALDLLGQAHLVPETLVAALTYTINVPGLPHGSESVYHFWTLAAEEQFYLVWPLLILLFVRPSLRRLAVVLGGLTAVSFDLSVTETARSAPRA